MSIQDLSQAESESILMARIVRALEDAGITRPVVQPEFEIDTVTIMGINLVTVDGVSFTIGIDTL